MTLLRRLREFPDILWKSYKKCSTPAREPQPQIYAVKTIAISEPSNVIFAKVPHTKHLNPSDVRKKIVKWFEHFRPTPNHNRGRLFQEVLHL